MKITHERRRNAYAANCCVCYKPVNTGEGWLYADTKSQRSRYKRQFSGRWTKKVKCDRCHAENLAHKWQADNLDNPNPAELVIRPWSVTQVKKWAVERGEENGDTVLFVVGSFGRENVSHRDRINSRFSGNSEYSLEQYGIAGKPLSLAAAKELGGRILAAIVAVQSEEDASTEAAAKLLTAAGAVVERWCGCTHCLKVEYKGGKYTLFGRVGGNRLSGHGPDQKWVETTAEELLASN